MSMHIQIDRTLCDSQALCVSIAPDVFEMDDDDVLHVVDERPPEEARDRVTAAVNSCPKTAISVVEE